VAEFIVKQMIKETKQSTQMQEILLNDVLLGTDCLVIRTFLDSLLEESQLSKEALKEFGEKFNDQWNEIVSKHHCMKQRQNITPVLLDFY